MPRTCWLLLLPNNNSRSRLYRWAPASCSQQRRHQLLLLAAVHPELAHKADHLTAVRLRRRMRLLGCSTARAAGSAA